jgi:hypothetical protein
MQLYRGGPQQQICNSLTFEKTDEVRNNVSIKAPTPLYLDRIAVRQQLSRVYVSYTAQKKGSIYLRIWKNGSTTFTDINISKGETE